MASRTASRPVLAASLIMAAPAAAQDASAPGQATPVITPTPSPSPSVLLLPTPTQTPTPTVAPTVRSDAGKPLPRVVLPEPRRATAVIRPQASPTPTPIAGAPAAPLPTPTPTPTAQALRKPPSPIETVILPPPSPAIPLWPWLLGPAGVLVLMLAWVLVRRQDEDIADKEVWADPVPPLPVPNGPALAVTLRPTRAGLNLISATAECEVTVANRGDAPATTIQARMRLTSLHDGQDTELAAFYADTAARPVTPMFTLAPGEERRLRAVTALPHEAIHALDAGGRPMFVPLVVLSIRYGDGVDERQIGQAYALGVERPDAAKLAPLWLDGPARQYDNVAARLHGAMVQC